MSNKINIPGRNYIEFFDLRLLKKSNCCKCGEKLKIKFFRYRELKEYGKFTISAQIYTFCYYCEKCNYYIEYKNQKRINDCINEAIIDKQQREQLIKKYKMNLIKEEKWFIRQ